MRTKIRVTLECAQETTTDSQGKTKNTGNVRYTITRMTNAVTIEGIRRDTAFRVGDDMTEEEVERLLHSHTYEITVVH